MTLTELQKWINIKIKELSIAPVFIKEDGVLGQKTKDAFLSVMATKNATAITPKDLKAFALQLGDTDTKRIEAIAKVESNGSGWDKTGMMVILYERHLMYRYVSKEIPDKTFTTISNPSAGGYTIDSNQNNINDSWEKLVEAFRTDIDSAIKSVSVGKFQVLCKYYDLLGYNSPLDMLYACCKSEVEHYKTLVGYVLKVANIKTAFLKISTNPEDCIPFVRAYNGPNWIKNDYANKLAKAMRG